jgi:fatty-acyl-CoA synthase
LSPARIDGPAPDSHPTIGTAYVRAIDEFALSWHTVGDLLDRAAQSFPEGRALAWLTPDGLAAMTWREVHRHASVISAELAILNPNRGRVVLAADNSVEWVLAFYGCALAGMAIVPMSPWSSADEVHHICTRARVAVVLAAPHIGDDPVLTRLRRCTASITNTPMIRSISDWPPTLAGSPPNGLSDPDDEFLVQYTSGTTGLPKAASLSHRAVVGIATTYADAVGAQPGDTWLNPLPLHHVGGSVAGLLSCLSIPGTYVVLNRFTPEGLVQAVREARPTSVGTVPTMLIDLLSHPGVTDADFASVRTVIGGATDVDPGLIDVIEKRLGIRFLVAYGQSEAPCLAVSRESDDVEVRTRSLGRPLPGRDYYIADGSGAVAEVGTEGELCVRGPLTMTGYLRIDGSVDPDVDAAGWRRTGDLCVLGPNGVLIFRGRLRDVIIRGGANIYPAEIEHVLSRHEAVNEVAVFGVPDDRLGERVVAAVIAHRGAELSTSELAEKLEEFVLSRLSSQKRPAEWLVVGDFPRTSTGKIRKNVLRERYAAGTMV